MGVRVVVPALPGPVIPGHGNCTWQWQWLLQLWYKIWLQCLRFRPPTYYPGMNIQILVLWKMWFRCIALLKLCRPPMFSPPGFGCNYGYQYYLRRIIQCSALIRQYSVLCIRIYGGIGSVMLLYLQSEINNVLYQQYSQHHQLLAHIAQLAHLQQGQYDALNARISALHEQFLSSVNHHVTSPSSNHLGFKPIIHQSEQSNQAVVIIGGCFGSCSTVDTEIFSGGKFNLS